LNLRSISDLQFSPDGNRLRLWLPSPRRESAARANMDLREAVQLDSGSLPIPLSPISCRAGHPETAKQLAFLSDRDDQQQVYAMPGKRRRASALTKEKRSVQNFAWFLPTASRLPFLPPRKN